MTTNQLPKEAFPIHFDKDNRHGTGFGFGFSVRTENTTGTRPAASANTAGEAQPRPTTGPARPTS